jgi:hypothetical protein
MNKVKSPPLDEKFLEPLKRWEQYSKMMSGERAK